MRPVTRAGWLAADSAEAARLQWAGLRGRDRPEDFEDGSLRPVIALPGVYETWHFMLPIIRTLHQRGHPVHVLPTLAHNSRPIVDTARMVADVVERRDLADLVIVAHSKGGLIGKYAMIELDPGHRLARMLAVASPFSGSRYASYAPSRALRAFRPTDPTTVRLMKERTINSRITSVFPAFDPLVPEGSELPGAENIRLPIGGHWTPLTHPTTLAVAVELASARPGDEPA